MVKMKKGIAFKILLYVVAFVILLLVALLFMTVGKDYLSKIPTELFKLLGFKE